MVMTALQILAAMLVLPLPGVQEPAKKTPAEIAAAAADSVITLRWTDIETGEETSSGTAFFLENGLLVTNWHVAANNFGGYYPWMQTGEQEFTSIQDARVVWESEEADLVLLELGLNREMRARPLELGQPQGFHVAVVGNFETPDGLRVSLRSPAPGEGITVIGSPLGLHATVSTGIVSAVREFESGGKLLQISADISPGSSGSPVFDDTGGVVGVASGAIESGAALGFAIPLSALPTMPPAIASMRGDRATSLSDWAIERITPMERDFSHGLYAAAVDRVLPQLRTLLQEGIAKERESPIFKVFLSGPHGYPTNVDDLRAILATIEMNAPERLSPGETKPPMFSWLHATFILDDDDDVFSQAMHAAAESARKIGSDDPRVLKWVASFVPWGLEAAHEALPTDELILFNLIRGGGSGVGQARGLSRALADSPDVASAEWFTKRYSDVEVEVARGAERADALMVINPSWQRVSDYWHARGLIALAKGNAGDAAMFFANRWNEPDSISRLRIFKIGGGYEEVLYPVLALGIAKGSVTVSDISTIVSGHLKAAETLVSELRSNELTDLDRIYLRGDLHIVLFEVEQAMSVLEEAAADNSAAAMLVESHRKRIANYEGWISSS